MYLFILLASARKFPFVNWASSSVWLERALDKREVGGSSPPWPTILFGGLAQLGERLICIQEVVGSIPISSTKLAIVLFVL